jgi:hypothetical protein
MQFYDRPLRRAEDDKGEASVGEVLLVTHVFIGGDKDIETGCFSRVEQVTIAESIPTAIFGFRDRVTDSARAMPFGVTWSKRMSIEGLAGQRGSVEAAGGKLKHLADLFARNVELLDDFVDRCAGFEVFEDGGDGHARVAKHPCTAQTTGNTFDGRTLRPIK